MTIFVCIFGRKTNGILEFVCMEQNQFTGVVGILVRLSREIEV